TGYCTRLRDILIESAADIAGYRCLYSCDLRLKQTSWRPVTVTAGYTVRISGFRHQTQPGWLRALTAWRVGIIWIVGQHHMKVAVSFLFHKAKYSLDLNYGRFFRQSRIAGVVRIRRSRFVI